MFKIYYLEFKHCTLEDKMSRHRHKRQKQSMLILLISSRDLLSL